MKNIYAILATLTVPALALAVETTEAAIGESVKHEVQASPFAGTIYQGIAAIVVFLAVFFVLKNKAWGPILKGLTDRENKIRQDLLDAEAARHQAEARLKDYDAKLATAESQVRELLNKATADAEKVATSIRMQAQQESEEAKERAMRDIENARKDALRDVYEQTATLATNVAEKILRRTLNADDQRDLVNASLDQLQGVSKN